MKGSTKLIVSGLGGAAIADLIHQSFKTIPSKGLIVTPGRIIFEGSAFILGTACTLTAVEAVDRIIDATKDYIHKSYEKMKNEQSEEDESGDHVEGLDEEEES